MFHTEKLLFIKEFCLQCTGTHFLGRRNHRFLSTANIHDIVINEVIDGVCIHEWLRSYVGMTSFQWYSILCYSQFQIKVIYLLIVRTKGPEFEKQPIVPLLSVRYLMLIHSLISQHMFSIISEPKSQCEMSQNNL